MQEVGITGGSKRNIGSDRKRVAGGQKHEVEYEAKKLGVSSKAVIDAVHEVGNRRSKVEQRLKSEK